MSQSDSDEALAAEERSQETKSFVRRVRSVMEPPILVAPVGIENDLTNSTGGMPTRASPWVTFSDFQTQLAPSIWGHRPPAQPKTGQPECRNVGWEKPVVPKESVQNSSPCGTPLARVRDTCWAWVGCRRRPESQWESVRDATSQQNEPFES